MVRGVGSFADRLVMAFVNRFFVDFFVWWMIGVSYGD